MPGLPVASGSGSQMSLEQKTSHEIIRDTMKSMDGVLHGMSGQTVMRTVPKQLTDAQRADREGDLKAALVGYVQVVAMLRTAFKYADAHKSSESVGIMKEMAKYNVSDIKAAKDVLVLKLENIERLQAIPSAPVDEIHSPSMSIADRKRQLEQHGVNTGAAAAATPPPRKLPVPPTAPVMSPSVSHAPVKPLPHVLVPTASLGPPSPTSPSASTYTSHATTPWTNGGGGYGSNHSTGNGINPNDTGSSSRQQLESPRLRSVQSNYSTSSKTRHEAGASPSSTSPHVTGGTDFNPDLFNSNFPSIEELEERSSPAIAAFRASDLTRPASTPNTPAMNSFDSRPTSPHKAHERSPAAYERSPMSPSIPLKPASLSSTPRFSSGVSPRELREWIQQFSLKVLLLDVRTRADFETERIGIIREQTQQEIEDMDATTDVAIACVEPSILERDNFTWEVLENALVGGGPSQESLVFKNRHQFDRVVIYDGSSQSFGGVSPHSPTFVQSPSIPQTNGTSNTKSPMVKLVRAIFELAPQDRGLKHPPVLLIGGLQAWKREFGGEFLLRGPSGGSPNASSAMPTHGSFSPPPRFPPNHVGMQAPMQPSSSQGFSSHQSPPPSNPHELWTPSRARADTGSSSDSRPVFEESPRYEPNHLPNRQSAGPLSYDYNTLRNGGPPVINGYRSPDAGFTSPSYTLPQPSNGYTMPESKLQRRPAIVRPPSASVSNTSSTNLSRVNEIPSAPIQCPSYTGSFKPSPGNFGMVSPPPQASVNPFLSRRRSEIQDQSQDLSPTRHTPIDYPNLHGIRPPPVAASSVLERQQPNRMRPQHGAAFSVSGAPMAPRLTNDNISVTYWGNEGIRSAGLKNMGNTCYMNSTVQCLSATVPFVRFFNDARWRESVNMVNTFGSKGRLAGSFAAMIKEMWHTDLPYLVPQRFRESICSAAPQFKGSDQHDSQEFLSFLLDGLHEDFNRVISPPNWKPPPDHEAKLELMPKQVASEQEWEIYRMRNDSLIVDFFQGQFQNRMECMTCSKTSTSYNSFMYLTLPVSTVKGSTKVSLRSCLDTFVKSEVMEKSDAWNCPNCKALRRATKKLTLSRLPPILLIHLKRFQVKGHFTDKIDTFVDFPLRGLDLTDYMPPPLPPGVARPQLNGGKPMSLEDPRTQLPPYRYDLYAVTNHFGSLSSGHYTASVSSRDTWLNCDDSRVSPTDPSRVVDKSAYILFYKRTKA